MRASTVVAVCGDPGGAAAIAPVLRCLQTDGPVAVFAYDAGVEILARRGFAVEQIAESADREWATRRLTEAGAGALLLATSCNRLAHEKTFLAAAMAMAVPSLGVIDFWSNYRCRFEDRAGRLSCVPDVVAVMDDRAQREVVAAGVPADRVLITGQPAHDELARQRREFDQASRTRLRQQLGIGDGDLLVVFVSQPLRVLYQEIAGNGRHLGYHEEDVLELLAGALPRLRTAHRQVIHVMIRPHPKESAERFEAYRAAGIRVCSDAEADGRQLTLIADVVVGMNSMLLMEACYLGAAVLSVQPDLVAADVLPANDWGITDVVYDARLFDGALERLLFDADHRSALRQRTGPLVTDEHAAQRIAAWLRTRSAASRSHATN